MTYLLWGISALIGLIWTGIAALSTQLVEWIATQAANGGVDDVLRSLTPKASPEPLAGWLDLFVGPLLQEQMQSMLALTLDWISQLGIALVWLEPLIWTVWAVGLFTLLLLTGIGHWVLRQWGATRKPA